MHGATQGDGVAKPIKKAPHGGVRRLDVVSISICFEFTDSGETGTGKMGRFRQRSHVPMSALSR